MKKLLGIVVLGLLLITPSQADDKSGKSKTRITDYYFKSGAQIRVMCLDWSAEITTKNGWDDQMQIVVNSKEFTNFLQNEAFK